MPLATSHLDAGGDVTRVLSAKVHRKRVNVSRCGTASTPAPKATAKPNPSPFADTFAPTTSRVKTRALPEHRNQLNQQSVNFAGSLHLDYRIAGSGFSVGVRTYMRTRSTAATTRVRRPLSAPPHRAGGAHEPEPPQPDTTLPAYGLSTFYETYLQYEKVGSSPVSATKSSTRRGHTPRIRAQAERVPRCRYLLSAHSAFDIRSDGHRPLPIAHYE